MDWDQLPPSVSRCCQTLWQAGFDAFPVGGGVRDLLLGRQPLDWDVTTSARPEQVSILFPQAIPTGIRHGTVTLPTEDGPIEVTTFRTEQGYSDGRHPDAVRFNATLEQDLARRDFTVNAMALDRDGGIIDLFGGREDLAAGIIRCVGDPERRFSEDALRMFRAVRFSAQLGFTVEEHTRTALFTCSPGGAAISPERVLVELQRLLCSPRPEQVLLLFQAGLMRPFTSALPSPLDGLAPLPPRPLERWAGLCAALGQPPEPFLRALRLENRLLRPCVAGWEAWNAGLPGSESGWRRLLARLGDAGARAAAAMGGAEALAGLDALLASRPCVSVEGLALSGGDLVRMGYAGPAVGEAQRKLLDHVLDRPEDNRPEVLTALLNTNYPVV